VISGAEGGQVRYRASTESPIVVQGCTAAPASDSYAGADALGTGQQPSVVQVCIHVLQSSSVCS